jgi:voltage-gated potassium channel Kch
MVTAILVTAGLALVGAALFDAFETVVLPRRVSRRLRLARAFYLLTWRPCAAIARRRRDDARREAFLSFYGPSSLLALVGLWALVLILGFALLHRAAGSFTGANGGGLATDLYFSGTTFFTLGLGDVAPASWVARLLAVAEAGLGFAFLALLIGYVPVVYQLFARREANVALLDQRAGSPPSAAELVRRNVADGDPVELVRLLREWEAWVGDLLETHLSYPALAYFRSQHENQSWLAALAVILDLSAYVLACGRTPVARQAGFTFAIGRHAVGDLCGVLGLRPRPPGADRLDAAASDRLWALAARTGLRADSPAAARERLTAIRSAYEPYLAALAAHLLMELPPWVPAAGALDNWETTAWDFASPTSLLGPGDPFRGDD